MLIAWEKIEELIERNAKHRKGFRLQEVDENFILNGAQLELNELKEDQNSIHELADIFGCLIHYAIIKQWSMKELENAIIEKVMLRFESPDS